MQSPRTEPTPICRQRAPRWSAKSRLPLDFSGVEPPHNRKSSSHTGHLARVSWCLSCRFGLKPRMGVSSMEICAFLFGFIRAKRFCGCSLGRPFDDRPFTVCANPFACRPDLRQIHQDGKSRSNLRRADVHNPFIACPFTMNKLLGTNPVPGQAKRREKTCASKLKPYLHRLRACNFNTALSLIRSRLRRDGARLCCRRTPPLAIVP